MSILRVVLALALAGGCTKVPTNEPPTNDRGDRPGVIAPAPAKATATVTLVSVSFANDCGGTPPSGPPAPPAPNRRAPSAQAPQDSARPDVAKERYRCEQTSMQLSIAANKDATVKIKTVEVLDDKGASLGMLSTTKPTRWAASSSAYEAWDEKVAAGQTALVSYVLSQPGFVNRYDSHDRMYTVKVTASVGGIDQALQTTVMVVAQPAPVPT
jgi:hypothetical protein